MSKWYVGTTNDAAFIIDRPPRPSHDDMADVAGVSVIGCLGTDFDGARRICEVHNRMVEALAFCARILQIHADIHRKERGCTYEGDCSTIGALEAAKDALYLPTSPTAEKEGRK